MTVETKYGIDDRIYALRGGAIFTGIVTKVEFTVSHDFRMVNYFIDKDRFSEDSCYHTKEEAIASIKVTELPVDDKPF